MDRTVDRTVIDRNTVPNLRKAYKIRWCTVITVPYRITVNRTVHRRVTTLIISYVKLCTARALYGYTPHRRKYFFIRKALHGQGTV